MKTEENLHKEIISLAEQQAERRAKLDIHGNAFDDWSYGVRKIIEECIYIKFKKVRPSH